MAGCFRTSPDFCLGTSLLGLALAWSAGAVQVRRSLRPCNSLKETTCARNIGLRVQYVANIQGIVSESCHEPLRIRQRAPALFAEVVDVLDSRHRRSGDVSARRWSHSAAGGMGKVRIWTPTETASPLHGVLFTCCWPSQFPGLRGEAGISGCHES